MKHYIKNFINKFCDPVCAIIPDNFETYLKEVSVDVRSAYKKNMSRYKVCKVDMLGDTTLTQISDIWHSSAVRQGRPINYNYESINGVVCRIGAKWVINDYTSYDFGSQKLEMFVCLDDHDIAVGYLELLSSNGVSIVHSTMAHQSKLKDNIMRYIFASVVKLKMPSIKYLVYNNYDKGNPTWFFKEDLNIINRGKLDILREESNK